MITRRQAENHAYFLTADKLTYAEQRDKRWLSASGSSSKKNKGRLENEEPINAAQNVCLLRKLTKNEL